MRGNAVLDMYEAIEIAKGFVDEQELENIGKGGKGKRR
jgi:hypothetical protein